MIRVLYLFLLFPFMASLSAFDKVVIWGHKLHSHTHSYIHYGFYRAFKEIGYPTYWFDNDDDVSSFDFSNSLFLTETQVDKNIPIRRDCLYILHSCKGPKYKELRELGRAVTMCYYSNIVETKPTCFEYEPCVYFDLPEKTFYIPWATDLLPAEIDKIKKDLPFITQKKQVCYLGTIGYTDLGKNDDQLFPYFEEAISNDFTIVKNDPWSRPLSPTDYIKLSQESMLSPALQGAWQVSVGYIPCRIFKSISYGCIGITNSQAVFDLFKEKIVYDADPVILFYKSLQALKTTTLEDRLGLMDFVRDHHTYINRVETILEFFRLLNLE